MRPKPFLTTTLGLAFTGWVIVTAHAHPSADLAGFRSGSTRPAQATAVPPISTCVPPTPGGSPTPPGLYPWVSVSEVTIGQVFDAMGCPGVDMVLRITLRNDGPAPSGAFAMRVDGCGVGRLEVTVDDIDMFRTSTVEIPGASIPPGPCAIMLDPSCGKHYFDRHWSGDVPHPEPMPTCTPKPAVTATVAATAVGTAVVTVAASVSPTRPLPTATSTEVAWLLLPSLRTGR